VHNRSYYELRTYRVVSQDKAEPLLSFLQTGAIPAWNRLGIRPAGLFRTVFGPDMASVHVLLPHPGIESFVTLRDRLLQDDEYRTAYEGLLKETQARPYVRAESSLMVAFPSMPGLELPDGNTDRASRIFELRIYESPHLLAHKKKIEMFDQAGEIPIFRKTGLRPVLFAESLAGPRLPNLVYMLTFDDMRERDEAWERFKVDPEWATLSGDPQFADTVSVISDLVLRPTPGSQI
jgi:hypothetical protein